MIGVLDETPLSVTPAGSALAVAVNAGDLTLTVEWGTDFDARGGLFAVDDSATVYAYTGADDDTLTLAAPFPTALLLDDDHFILALNAQGEVEQEFAANVWLDPDNDETPTPCEVANDVALRIRDDSAGLPVTVEPLPDGSGYRMVALAGVNGLLDGSTIYNPYASRNINTTNLQTAVFTQLTSFTEIASDSVTLSGGSHTVQIGGTYRTELQVFFQAAPTGTRRVRIRLNGVQIGYNRVSADDSGDTTAVLAFSPPQPFAEGDVVTIEAFQSSGATLQILAGASVFSIYRISV